ncbi:MAG: exosortase/archaeosortase family protein [candidate division Zixibacteria bacterium]|nr:exosortase/archaeosortase family protein [candidate division Zixibacteria bacterium]
MYKIPFKSPPLWLWGILVITFLWAYMPTVRGLVNTWSGNEDYSHGFIVIPVVIYLIYRKACKKQLQMQKVGLLTQLAGSFGIILCLILSIVGTLTGFHTLSNLSFVFGIVISLYFLLGSSFTKEFRWELAFLIFLIPVPAAIYARLTLPLQLLTSQMSSALLQFFNFPIYQSGNLLYLTSTTLQVVNACSGLRSIISILALAYILSLLSFNSSLCRTVLIFAAIPVAILVNILRIIVLALSSHFGSSIFFAGYGHTLLGMSLFVVSVAILLVIRRLISWAYIRE